MKRLVKVGFDFFQHFCRACINTELFHWTMRSSSILLRVIILKNDTLIFQWFLLMKASAFVLALRKKFLVFLQPIFSGIWTEYGYHNFLFSWKAYSLEHSNKCRYYSSMLIPRLMMQQSMIHSRMSKKNTSQVLKGKLNNFRIQTEMLEVKFRKRNLP